MKVISIKGDLSGLNMNSGEFLNDSQFFFSVSPEIPSGDTLSVSLYECPVPAGKVFAVSTVISNAFTFISEKAAGFFTVVYGFVGTVVFHVRNLFHVWSRTCRYHVPVLLSCAGGLRL